MEGVMWHSEGCTYTEGGTSEGTKSHPASLVCHSWAVKGQGRPSTTFWMCHWPSPPEMFPFLQVSSCFLCLMSYLTTTTTAPPPQIFYKKLRKKIFFFNFKTLVRC